MTKYAVMGCTEDHGYSFSLPLTCALWAQHGLKPLVFQIGDWKSREGTLSINTAKALGARVVNVPLDGCIWSGHWMSKCVRFMACLVTEPDDVLVTTDADMAVLDPRFMENRDDGKEFRIWFSNAYNGAVIHGAPVPYLYPMCYLEAKAQVWRDLVRPVLPDVQKATMRFLDKWSDVGVERNGNFSDEMILRALLQNWRHFPHGCQFASRESHRPMAPCRRVETNCEPVENAIDFHLPRPDRGGAMWHAETWEKVMNICAPVLSSDRRRQLGAYFDEYTGDRSAS